jgi:hypothetical protein
MTGFPLKTLIAVLLALFGLGSLTSCAEDPKPLDDLPESEATYDREPRKVYVNYDAFPNVVTWCDGANQIYATTRASDSLTIVADSPNCQDGPR